MAMFRTARLSLEMGSFFADMMAARGLAAQADILVGPSYKGSAIALAAAIALWRDHGTVLLCDYDRKEAKKHGEGSTGKRVFVNSTFFEGCRIFVVDDVATSMGTKFELVDKIRAESAERNLNVHILGVGIGIDREQTTAVYSQNGQVIPGRKGKDAIADFTEQTGIPVHTVAGIREVVAYLFEKKIPVRVNGVRKPIDGRTKQIFDEYMDTYGVG